KDLSLQLRWCTEVPVAFGLVKKIYGDLRSNCTRDTWTHGVLNTISDLVNVAKVA
ncbi:MAG: hypothetical protein JWN34_1372, partial [Bryobacterales bacterium]|nr:hypothetical protein [Bryobacterales bacterium]